MKKITAMLVIILPIIFTIPLCDAGKRSLHKNACYRTCEKKYNRCIAASKKNRQSRRKSRTNTCKQHQKTCFSHCRKQLERKEAIKENYKDTYEDEIVEKEKYADTF